MKIEDLNLTYHTLDILRHAGIDTVEDLQAAVKDGSLAAVRGLGKNSHTEVLQRLKRWEESEAVEAPSIEDVVRCIGETTKKRIIKYFREDHSAAEKAKFVADEFGIGGCTYGAGFLDHDSKGLRYWITSSSDSRTQYTWNQAAKAITGLIAAGTYMDSAELPPEPDAVPIASLGLSEECTEHIEEILCCEDADDLHALMPDEESELQSRFPEDWAKIKAYLRPEEPAAPGKAESTTLPAPAPETDAAPDTLQPFDYSGLTDETVSVLHLAENEIRDARQIYVCRVSAAVASVREELVTNCHTHNNQYSENNFTQWCNSVGLNKRTAYRLLQVNMLLNGATAEEAAQLEKAPPSLLYAAAAPSAPEELVQAVKDGDITTHKDYQAALARIKELEKEKAQAETQYEEAFTAANRFHARADAAEAARSALLDQQGEYIGKVQAMELELGSAKKSADLAARKTKDAEDQLILEKSNRMDLERQLKATEESCTEAQLRIRELESRPVEVAVEKPDPKEIERLANEKAQQMTAMYETQLSGLQRDLQSARAKADQTDDAAYDAADAFATQAAHLLRGTLNTFRALIRDLDDYDISLVASDFWEEAKAIYEEFRMYCEEDEHDAAD